MKKTFWLLGLLLWAGSAVAQNYRTEANLSYLHAPDTLRLLAIGNSFSEDAVENNLWELLDAAGIPAIVGNLYIGGCTLERHQSNACSNAPAYRLRKIAGGKMAERQGVRLSEALQEEAWTHVSFQQASAYSGLVATYEPYLTQLLQYVKGYVPEGCTFLFHQTWAYARDADHPAFPVYESSQTKMYRYIVRSVSSVLSTHPEITLLIPSGTAIQNARTSFLEDRFTRDGYHLEPNFGRYTAACAWYAALTGRFATDNPWKPEQVSEEEAAVCRKAADLAVASPFASRSLQEALPQQSAAAYREERCRLDVYYPASRKPFKTLVWFHGGGLTGGEKYIPQELCKQGIAVVAANYRLFPQASCVSAIRDAASAVAWTLRNIADYGGDPAQVYVSGHSAGGYLSLMLALDKQWLGAEGIDADSLAAYYPISGQTATHFTIRKERGISYTTPIVDSLSPLGSVRKLGTRLVLYTGERSREMMARYEENLYLKSVLEGIGNETIPLFECIGADHGTVLQPALRLILEDMR